MATGYLDHRLGKTYGSSKDVEFRSDTFRTAILFNPDDDVFYSLEYIIDAFDYTERTTSDVLAKRLADCSLQDRVSWKLGSAMCHILGCAPEGEMNIDSGDKFLAAVNSKFDKEFSAFGSAESKRASEASLPYLVIAGKADEVRKYLETALTNTPAATKPQKPAQAQRQPPQQSSRRRFFFFGRHTSEEELQAEEMGGNSASDEEASEGEFDDNVLLETIERGLTPLHLAVFFDLPDCVSAIIESAAKLSPDLLRAVMEAQDEIGTTPLMFAIKRDCFESAKRLLAAGADANLSRPESYMAGGSSAMEKMIKIASVKPEEYLEPFKELFELAKAQPGFNINARRSESDWDAMDFGPAWLRNLYNVEEEAGEVEEEADDEEGAEDDAAAEEERAGEGGEAAADRNSNRRRNRTRGPKGPSLAGIAAGYGGIECLQILLAAGAKVEPTDLIYAVTCAYKQGGRGRNPYLLDDDPTGGSVETLACLACIRMLLDTGVDINGKDRDGNTALHKAAEFGLLEVAKLLMDRKANMRVQNKDEQTPMEVAEESGNSKIVDYFNTRSKLLRLMSRTLSRQRPEQEEVPEEEACKVCLTKRRSVALAPCGHKVCCKSCIRTILVERPAHEQKCPYCRAKIESFILEVFEV